MIPYDPLSLFILDGEEVTRAAELRRRAWERSESEPATRGKRRPSRRHVLPPYRVRHV